MSFACLSGSRLGDNEDSADIIGAGGGVVVEAAEVDTSPDDETSLALANSAFNSRTFNFSSALLLVNSTNF